jgi:hypothetical protein
VLAHLEAEKAVREAALAEKAKNTVRVDPATLTAITRKRYAGLAESSLARLVSRLTSKRKPGRNTELYTVTCFMAPYVRVGAIKEADVRSDFEEACKQNGLVEENGMKDVRKTMNRAFLCSTDGLPDLSKLEDRPYRWAA